jgi:hypothetical protein
MNKKLKTIMLNADGLLISHPPLMFPEDIRVGSIYDMGVWHYFADNFHYKWPSSSRNMLVVRKQINKRSKKKKGHCIFLNDGKGFKIPFEDNTWDLNYVFREVDA